MEDENIDRMVVNNNGLSKGKKANNQYLLEHHPCYSEKAHFRISRLHLPVAPKCNIHCNFCDKKISQYYHTSRPGLTYKILQPKEAIKKSSTPRPTAGML